MHWVNLFHEITPHSRNEKKVSLDEIKEVYGLFRKKIFKHFFVAPEFLERLNFLQPITFYLHDLDVNVVLSYREALKFEDGCKVNSDISLSAATLQFILKNEYGANTTHVNGKFERISDKGVRVFARHFSPQDYMKMGYGLNIPFTTFRILVGKMFQKLFQKSWDINPSSD